MVSHLPASEKLWRVPEEEINLRRDLRKTHRIVSIDPLGSTDIDDAISVKFLKESNVIELGVRILYYFLIFLIQFQFQFQFQFRSK
jgi:exoribonuclease R